MRPLDMNKKSHKQRLLAIIFSSRSPIETSHLLTYPVLNKGKLMNYSNEKTATPHQPESSLSNIIFNIVLPTIILNKGHKVGLDARYSVLLAFSFPFFFSLKSWFKYKKLNFISLLGLLNVTVSGTLTILALGGLWFAVKEAAFPLLIGMFVLASSWTKGPFFESLFMNPNAFDQNKINQFLNTDEKRNDFHKLMVHATRFLSISFLMSATLNYFLALKIFTPLPESLTEIQKQELLNEQLSHMNLYALGVIMVPSIIFLAGLLYYVFHRIHKITGLKTDDLLVSK